MVHTHDDGASGKEQQRFEESMRHQVKHRHRVGRGTERHRHVTELRQRRISDDALDVVLDDAQETHEKGRDGANRHNEVQGRFAEFEQRRHARDHEDTGCHHGGSVDQGRDRGRAFHGIGQPDVQRELCRFAHGTNEQADADHGHQHPVSTREAQLAQFGRLGECFRVVQRAGKGCNQTDAKDKTEVTDAIDQEGLHVGKDGAGLVEPETDQQIGHQTHRFPAEEQLQHVVAHHQHQHRESKQRNVGKEAVVAFVFLHVADRVEVNHQ